jgi:hypothetical protein
MKNIKFIGITGVKRSGKDSIAGYLLAHLPNSQRVAFGDFLKTEAALSLASDYFFTKKLKVSSREELDIIFNNYYSEMHSDEIDERTGLAVKENYRLLLQWWGTDYRRNMFSKDYWISRLVEHVETIKTEETTYVIVPDVRFINEAEFIIKNDGLVIKVERPSDAPKDSHVSETELDHIEVSTTIGNSGTLADLEQQVVEFIEKYQLK